MRDLDNTISAQAHATPNDRGDRSVQAATVASPVADDNSRALIERYELMLRASTDGLWDWDLRTGTVHYSDRWKEQIGYEPHELGQGLAEWHSRLHPDDQAAADGFIHTVLSGRDTAYEMEYRLRCRDGSYRWFRARGAVGYDDLGEPVRLAGSQQDIHERKLAEEWLGESQRVLMQLFSSLPLLIYQCHVDNLWSMEFVSEQSALIVGLSPDALSAPSMCYLDMVHPDDRDTLRREVEDAIREDRDYECQYRVITPAGEIRWVLEQGHGVRNEGGQVRLREGFISDVTERVRAIELLEQRVAERTQEITTLLEVSRRVASRLELEPLLEVIFDQIAQVVDYNASSIMLRDADDSLTMTIIANRRDATHAGVRPTAGVKFTIDPANAMWNAILSGEWVIIPDVRGNSDEACGYRLVVGDRLNDTYRFTTTWMGIPLRIKDRVIGLLILTSGEADHYSPHQAELVTAIAQQAAVAIDNARLHARTRELAALEERQRLARELHDSVSQALYGIGLGAETARTYLQRDPTRAAQPIDYILELARGGMAEMRALIFELRPESLENEGLVAAIEKQAAAIQARHRLPVEIDAGDEPDITIEAKEALYRIAQEAMHNAMKHARATTLDVALDVEGERVTVTVRDNGAGFDTAGEFPGHLGLKSMRERALRAGGRLTIESEPGKGTTVRACVPAMLTGQ